MTGLEPVGILPKCPELVRTLSKHHWQVGIAEMARDRVKKQWVGDHGDWAFYLIRDNTVTRHAQAVTMFRGVVKDVSDVFLPIPRRCTRFCKNGRRCSLKTYGRYCSKHI